jgi:hypothetical protein
MEVGDQLVPAASLAARLQAGGLLPRGATVVLVSVNPDLTRPDANFLHLMQVPVTLAP